MECTPGRVARVTSPSSRPVDAEPCVTKSAVALFSTTGMSDAELVRRAREGDAGALRDLVDRHYDDCWRYAFRVLGDRADAEDVVQETFLRAHAALANYREQAQFREWLFTILVNQCRNAATSRARRQQRFVAVEASALPQPAVPPAALPDDDLARAIAQLEPAQREALLLRFGEDMDYDQMARATGASTSALKMRVKRACDRLRTMLGERRP
jgi:RNA polymerase sigma-70 factor (ECF subfamily)